MRARLALVGLVATLGCSFGPPLCLRTPTARALPRMAFPVGVTFRFAAGQRDILDECDREPPPEVAWSTSAPAIASVDQSGVLRARAPGTVEVIARAGGAEARFAVTVVPPVARIAISPAGTAFAVGDTVRFRALAYGVDGRPLPEAVLALEVRESRASHPRADAPSGLRPVYHVGADAPRPVPNTLDVHADRVASGHVVASVVGRSDSIAVRAIAP